MQSFNIELLFILETLSASSDIGASGEKLIDLELGAFKKLQTTIIIF